MLGSGGWCGVCVEELAGGGFDGEFAGEDFLFEGGAEGLDSGVRVKGLAEAVFDDRPEPAEVLFLAAVGEAAVPLHRGLACGDCGPDVGDAFVAEGACGEDFGGAFVGAVGSVAGDGF